MESLSDKSSNLNPVLRYNQIRIGKANREHISFGNYPPHNHAQNTQNKKA